MKETNHSHTHIHMDMITTGTQIAAIVAAAADLLCLCKTYTDNKALSVQSAVPHALSFR